MDVFSWLLMFNVFQGLIDKNCLLGGDWQLLYVVGELLVICWYIVMQGEV